ncbi:choline/ethanolamine kinase-like isoform X2 [Gordionus sp. m RMFG-2023]|uniref:choline/ethanolamine kinase-like isoform X2 n=1 Tax=Gordionus sp. m RMFG-2023 TaxID=3053472 RepID=UPI0031FD5770
MNVPKDFFEKAFSVCKDYLYGVWKYIPKEEFLIKPINGGLTNYIYLCELPPRYELMRRENEPKRVLLRFYGIGKLSLNEGSSPVLNHLSENLLCAILAERKLGPKLYGVFNGGRIEEYIPARCLFRKELFDPTISCKIAEKLAKIHALNTLPFSKDPNKIFDKMFKWLQIFMKNLNNPKSPTHKNSENASKYDWTIDACLDKEIEYCRILSKNSDSPIVFCHFDLQEGNILIHRHQHSMVKAIKSTKHSESNFNSYSNNSNTDVEIKLDFIDYEYSAYTYRGFDIANHFCEWTMDYTFKEYPYFSLHSDNFPTKDQQRLFLEVYLRSYHEAVRYNKTRRNKHVYAASVNKNNFNSLISSPRMNPVSKDHYNNVPVSKDHYNNVPNKTPSEDDLFQDRYQNGYNLFNFDDLEKEVNGITKDENLGTINEHESRTTCPRNYMEQYKIRR